MRFAKPVFSDERRTAPLNPFDAVALKPAAVAPRPWRREHDAFDLSRVALKIMGANALSNLKFRVFLGVRRVTPDF
jgi:hypothetical protein